MPSLGVDVFHFHRGFIHENANSKRESAERHDVDGLPRRPQQDYRCQQREWNVHDDDHRAAPVAKKKEHHQAGENRPQHSFVRQIADGIRHEGRLVELQAHVHVFRNCFLKRGDSRFHSLDNGQRRSVGALCDRNIDGALAIDVSVGGYQIGAILNRADVAKVNGCARFRTDRRAQQFGQVSAER